MLFKFSPQKINPYYFLIALALLSSCASARHQDNTSLSVASESTESYVYENYFNDKPVSIEEQIETKTFITFNTNINNTSELEWMLWNGATIWNADFAWSLFDLNNPFAIRIWNPFPYNWHGTVNGDWVYYRGTQWSWTNGPNQFGYNPGFRPARLTFGGFYSLSRLRTLAGFSCGHSFGCGWNQPNRDANMINGTVNLIASNSNLQNSSSLISNDRSAISKSRRAINLSNSRISSVETRTIRTSRPRGRDLSLTTVRRNNPNLVRGTNPGGPQSSAPSNVRSTPRRVAPVRNNPTPRTIAPVRNVPRSSNIGTRRTN